MIGIALRSPDRCIVTEFFELFKTPWAWFSPDKKFEVIICDDAQENYPEARLIIMLHPTDSQTSSSVEIQKESPTWARQGTTTFPIYTNVTGISHGTALVETTSSGLCIASYTSNGGRTVIHVGYDFFSEARVLLTEGQPACCADTPTLDRHINNLREWILMSGLGFVEVPPVASTGKYFVCLTHDVDFAGLKNHVLDRTAAGFAYRGIFKSFIQYLKGEYTLGMLLRNWMAVLELPFIYLGLRKDPWNTFKRYRAMEADAPSTFFFVPFKGEPGRTKTDTAPSSRAVKYSVRALNREIETLAAGKCEIGVHGIDSWIDSRQGRLELSEVGGMIDAADLGVRMHWLYFNPESPVKLEVAGYYYDSSSGYNETVGYKAGTSQVFKLTGTKRLFELPMHIMDSALFYPDRLNLTLSEGSSRISSMIQKAPLMGGVLTFNWHDRSIAPERLWDRVYTAALTQMRGNGAVFLTAKEVVEWFNTRRKVEFSQISGARVRVNSPDNDSVNGMVLRRYYRRSDGKSGEYLDTPLRGQTEIEH